MKMDYRGCKIGLAILRDVPILGVHLEVFAAACIDFVVLAAQMKDCEVLDCGFEHRN